MFKLLAKTLDNIQGELGCRPTFPRHLLHRITTLALSVSVVVIAQSLYIPALNAQSSDPPNIVLILADDMGYSDVGCYGGEIETPNLDRLAANGLRFTMFYNTGRCCPTRACLLTGLYPHMTGVGWMMDDQGEQGYRGNLNDSCVTIAEVLRPAGYGTYQVGKWHVTRFVNPQNDSEKANWPTHRGFDDCYSLINGASSMWDPNTLVRTDDFVTCKNDPQYQPVEPYHITDAFSDNAVQFIERHDFDAKPMFMYLAYTSAHWPLHARERDIAKYQGQYDAGYEAIRQTRLKRMIDLGVIAPDTQITNRSGKWEDVPDPEWEADCMEVYAAMIDQMDQGIGRVIASLEQKGQLDNTLIMFMQDNGGCQEGCGRQPDPAKVNPRAESPTLKPIADDQVHYFTSKPEQTRDGWPVRQGHVTPGPADTYIGYGQNWANVSNTPLREYKHFVHEGGISTPLIVHWPRGFAGTNELRHQVSHLIDIMATCVDVGNANYPSNVSDTKIHPMCGTSLRPAFLDQPLPSRTIFWEHEGNRALREGDWKLVAKGPASDRTREVKWELYNIANDRNENHDLSEQYPEQLNKMIQSWEAEAQRTWVYPCPLPK
ncbi:MAG: arylsulfatase [Pirellulaceae bacterium]